MSKVKQICAGIDIGSRTTKVVIWDGDTILGRSLVSTGWTPAESAKEAFGIAKETANLKEVDNIIATGYGRVVVPFADKSVTEITAHARGIAHQLPETRTLIDIGGQDSKAIILGDYGLVTDFAMNDRCAAGSGKFLEYLAMTMELPIAEFAELAYSSRNPVMISSICTVFAETEVLSLLAEGVSRQDIAVGVHRSIAMRVGQLTNSLHPQSPAAFSGGVAKNRCLVREISEVLEMDVAVPEDPEFTGALGAAILAAELQ